MENQYLTVTALTKYLKRKFDADPYLGRVYLTGELSNFKLRPNAHQYFSIKDNQAKISAIMFRSAFQKIKFTPKEGMKVLVVGRISLYEPGGSYQIYIERMEPDGVGALYQAFEELKERLGKEGLFSGLKKSLPKYPKRIAVITSPSGAVIRDIITTVKRRYPIAQLVLFPALVQGNQAADDIVSKIKQVEKMGNFDTLIVGRGGGSIEDLWPFNEEKVARAIFNSNLPVISSVGHETDVTIADMVADVRAPTPTAAAELAVPVLSDEILKIREKEQRLAQSMTYLLQMKQQRYNRSMASYIFQQPDRLYEGFSLKLDLLSQRLQQKMQQQITEKQKNYNQLNQNLLQVSPEHNVRLKRQNFVFLQQQLIEKMNYYLIGQQQRYQQAVNSLDLLSPLKTMSRGFTYTTKADTVIKSQKELRLKDEVNIHFLDGIATAKVTDIQSQSKINADKSTGKGE